MYTLPQVCKQLLRSKQFSTALRELRDTNDERRVVTVTDLGESDPKLNNKTYTIRRVHHH